MASPAEDTIAALANSTEALSGSRLANLSNIDSEGLKLFEQAWDRAGAKLRRETIHQLVEIAEDDIALNFDGIFKYCLGDTDTEVRTTAIEGLWENEDTPLIKPLVKLLEKDISPEVQAAAATALGRFALLAEFGKLRTSHKDIVRQALLRATADNNKTMEVRCHALEAIAILGQPEVSEAINEAYDSQEPELRISAINAMGKNCDPSWLLILLQEINSPDAEMRCEAAQACGELGEEEAVPHLIELVDDPDTSVALAAMQALGKIGGEQAKQYLKQFLDDPEDLVKQTARQALDELEAEEDPISFGM